MWRASNTKPDAISACAGQLTASRRNTYASSTYPDYNKETGSNTYSQAYTTTHGDSHNASCYPYYTASKPAYEHS